MQLIINIPTYWVISNKLIATGDIQRVGYKCNKSKNKTIQGFLRLGFDDPPLPRCR